MINNSIRFGAEVYTWYMHENGLTHAGKLGHMIEITAQAGFKGIEPIHYWMGNLKDPARLKDKLAEHRIALAAIALCLKWNDPTITEDEKERLLKQLNCSVNSPEPCCAWFRFLPVVMLFSSGENNYWNIFIRQQPKRPITGFLLLFILIHRTIRLPVLKKIMISC